MADGTRGAKRVAATLGPEQGREPDELERLVAGTLQGLVAAAPEAAPATEPTTTLGAAPATAAVVMAAGFWDCGGRSLKDQEFRRGCCVPENFLTIAPPAVLIII